MCLTAARSYINHQPSFLRSPVPPPLIVWLIPIQSTDFLLFFPLSSLYPFFQVLCWARKLWGQGGLSRMFSCNVVDPTNCLDKVQPRLTKLMIWDFKGKLGLSMAVTGTQIQTTWPNYFISFQGAGRHFRRDVKWFHHRKEQGRKSLGGFEGRQPPATVQGGEEKLEAGKGRVGWPMMTQCDQRPGWWLMVMADGLEQIDVTASLPILPPAEHSPVITR